MGDDADAYKPVRHLAERLSNLACGKASPEFASSSPTPQLALELLNKNGFIWLDEATIILQGRDCERSP